MSGLIIFETERLRVRQFVPADADDFYRIQGDPEIMRYIRKPKSRRESNRFLKENIELYAANPLHGRWAVVDRQDPTVFIGSMAVISWDQPDRIQIGYVLLAEYWGRGYATELVKTGKRYAFEKAGVSLLYGVTETPNTASQQVLLKNGFVFQETCLEGGKPIHVYTYDGTG